MEETLEILKEPQEIMPVQEVHSAPVLLPAKDHAEAAERRGELGRMVRRLFLAPSGAPARVVVFAPVDGNVDSARICVGTAEMLASQVNGSVCILDANLRNSRLHEQFHLQDNQGLSDALQGPTPLDKLATAIPGTNLSIIQHGSPVEHCEDLLNSDHMRERLKELRAHFDFVIVIAPAIGVYPDPILLGHYADGLVMVLEADETDRRTAIRAKTEVEAANVRLLGAVLNNRKFPIPDSIYKYL